MTVHADFKTYFNPGASLPRRASPSTVRLATHSPSPPPNIANLAIPTPKLVHVRAGFIRPANFSTFPDVAINFQAKVTRIAEIINKLHCSGAVPTPKREYFTQHYIYPHSWEKRPFAPTSRRPSCSCPPNRAENQNLIAVVPCAGTPYSPRTGAYQNAERVKENVAKVLFNSALR